MRKRDLYGKDISFDSDLDRENFEEMVFLKKSEWSSNPGEHIASGTFRTVREAVLENIQTGERLEVLQKKVHHPMGKRLPLIEAFKWWKLHKIGAPVVPFFKIDPDTLTGYVTDLRAGHGAHIGPSKVFDTNASLKALQDIRGTFEAKPLKNPQEVIQQIRGIITLLDLNGISAHTDEVFLMVVHEHDAVMQVLLGDLKMMDLDGEAEENIHSEKTLLRFLSRFGVVA